MTQNSTTGQNGSRNQPDPPTVEDNTRNHPKHTPKATPTKTTEKPSSTHRDPTRTSKVSVRIVFSTEPTEKSTRASFRHLLAKLLNHNIKNKHANVQLCPIKANGCHISRVDDIGFGEGNIEEYIEQQRMSNYRSKNKYGEPYTVYEYQGVIHLLHDIHFGAIKHSMLDWIKKAKMFINKETNGVALHPLAWVRGVRPYAHVPETLGFSKWDSDWQIRQETKGLK